MSFGSCDGALKWKKETNCLFPVWSDSGRHLYKALRFKRSMFQVRIKIDFFLIDSIEKFDTFSFLTGVENCFDDFLW